MTNIDDNIKRMNEMNSTYEQKYNYGNEIYDNISYVNYILFIIYYLLLIIIIFLILCKKNRHIVFKIITVVFLSLFPIIANPIEIFTYRFLFIGMNQPLLL